MNKLDQLLTGKNSSATHGKKELLNEVIEHIDITAHDTVSLIEAMSKMGFQARNLARAAEIYALMLSDKSCSITLSLAGSLFSAGLKRIIFDMIRFNMVDSIVATGAIIADQDFFEALGFKHYRGTPFVDDKELCKMRVDRIYDTYINEDELSICGEVITQIADSLEPRAYSSREFIWKMGQYLGEIGPKVNDSVVYAAYLHDVPIFVPAFSDCIAGFGLFAHQSHNKDNHLSIDSVKDFYELAQIHLAAEETGIFMIGGGVPKNFTQDIAVAGEAIGKPARAHKYAIQVTVADERDGALSGSTLKEACSWGKVGPKHEQMVYAEATIALPLIASYVYHKQVWKNRQARRYKKLFDEAKM